MAVAQTSPINKTFGHQQHFFAITAEKTLKWVPTAARWGLGAGIAAVMLLENVPRIKNDVLQKFPGLSNHFSTYIPPEDNPF